MRYKAFLLLVFLLSGCQETADTKDFGFNQSAKSPIDQVFKKSFTLSKNAYNTSLNENPWAQRLERLAAAGPQTENFSFKGYSESDIALARKVVRDHKNKIKDYRLQNESKPFQSVFPEDSLKTDGKFSIVYLPSTIKVESRETFDGKGKIFVWIGEGNCSQQEGMPPMFRVYEGAEIKNLFMINAPDGIHFMGSNSSADKIVNLDVCEDAMTGKPHDPAIKNITITISVFYHCEDKGLQVSLIRSGLKIIGNKFIQCAQPIRINKFIESFEARDDKITGAKDYYHLISYRKS